MRLFWGLVAVVVLAAAGWFAYSQMQARRAAEQAAQAQADAEIASDFADRQKQIEQERQAAAERAANAPPADPTQPSHMLGANTAPPSHTTVTGEAVPTNTTPAPAPANAAVTPAPVTPVAQSPAGPAAAAQTPSGPATPGAASELPDKIGDFAVRPISIEHKPDGTTVLAGKLTIKGEGTAEKPYDVPWDALTAAEQTLDPRAGRKEIPGVTAFLHNKHVRLRGYVSFPLMIKEPRECLAMLNPWDGCCIGVPPTPYDAVEVALTTPVTGNTRYATTGVVTGVFEVKPYLMGNWLVGLYVMSGGKLEPSDFRGPAGS